MRLTAATRAVAVLAALSLTVMTAGCTAETPSTETSPLSAAINQSRADHDLRIVSLEITNNSSETVSLVSAVLTSAQFEFPAAWARGTPLKPGLTVGLRVHLGPAVCPLPADVTPTVIVGYRSADEVSHSVELEPAQPSNTLHTVGADDCIAHAVAVHAGVTFDGSVTWRHGVKEPAKIRLAIDPTGAPGSLTIGTMHGTVLLGLASAGGALIQSVAINDTVDASSKTHTVSLLILPNRCDVHAVAEDKRGTIFPFEIATSEGDSGIVYVRSDDAMKRALFAYVADYCDFP
jgi:hypothetical protein